MTDTLFGYPVRLLIELPDGEHDVTHCIEILADPHARAEINARRLLDEIEIEKRTRARVIHTRASHPSGM